MLILWGKVEKSFFNDSEFIYLEKQKEESNQYPIGTGNPLPTAQYSLGITPLQVTA